MAKARDILIMIVCLTVSLYYGWQLVSVVVVRNVLTKAELVACKEKTANLQKAYQEHVYGKSVRERTK